MSAKTRAATTVPADVIERLKAAVGPAGYLDDPADIAPYCKSWRDDWVGNVPLVLRPAVHRGGGRDRAHVRRRRASPSCPRAATPASPAAASRTTT